MSKCLAIRAALGAAAVLSVREACALLPWGRRRAEAWLRARGLVREREDLGEYVIWGDVVAELRDRTEAQAPRPLSLRRLDLGA